MPLPPVFPILFSEFLFPALLEHINLLFSHHHLFPHLPFLLLRSSVVFLMWIPLLVILLF